MSEELSPLEQISVELDGVPDIIDPTDRLAVLERIKPLAETLAEGSESAKPYFHHGETLFWMGFSYQQLAEKTTYSMIHKAAEHYVDALKEFEYLYDSLLGLVQTPPEGLTPKIIEDASILLAQTAWMAARSLGFLAEYSEKRTPSDSSHTIDGLKDPDSYWETFDRITSESLELFCSHSHPEIQQSYQSLLKTTVIGLLHRGLPIDTYLGQMENPMQFDRQRLEVMSVGAVARN